MIDEFPGDAELLREVGAQGFDAEGLRGVVAAVDEIHPNFLSQGVGPVLAFASDKRVDAFSSCCEELAPGAAGADADPVDQFRTAGRQFGPLAGGLGHFLDERLAGKGRLEFSANVNAVPSQEGLALALDPDRLGEKRVVPVFGVDVERNVGAVDREVRLKRGVQLLEGAADDPAGLVPEKPVMNDEQTGLDGDGAIDHGLTRVDGGDDFCDLSGAVFQLQTVERLWVVGDFADLQQLVDVGDNFVEGGHGNQTASVGNGAFQAVMTGCKPILQTYGQRAMLKAGIVGLPNVGKSTLFNAVTRTRKAQAENYPFCTIDPNVGMVTVPDERLEVLSKISKSQKLIPTVIEFVDIAGLVAGASKGEGLGNKFLANIREVDAVVQVVRCFENDDIIHEMGSVDPLRDIEVINAELILTDMAALEKRHASREKKAKTGDKEAKREVEVIAKLMPHLDAGNPALTMELSKEEEAILREFFLLSAKPTIFACNVSEAELAAAQAKPEEHPFVSQVTKYAAENHGTEVVVISAKIEEEMSDLEPDEAAMFLEDLGVTDSGVSKLIKAVYHLLGLRTYLTTGEKETRAWTIHAGDKAPAAAGVIHSDFERGFIAAEVVAYEVLKELGSQVKAKEAGKLRIEGKEYVVQDGDVLEFRFNV